MHGLNRFSKQLLKINKFPTFTHGWLRNYAIGKTIKMVGSCGLKFEKLNKNEVIVYLPNKTKVQNHIGQIHAAATTLLAETATGIVLGLSLPDDKLPLIKNLSVKFIKRSQGMQKAIAVLTDTQIEKIKQEAKGDIVIEVKVTDETNEEVILADMNWAWITKKK
jgi:acyl-coenzyme A thioesterase PaaI-like protein